MTFIVSAIGVFVLGLVIGSFINVLVLRYKTGRAVIGGRSICLSCARELSWKDMLPIVSFFALKRKCRQCGSAISVQYPIVELLSGIVFLSVFIKTYPFLEYGYYGFFFLEFIFYTVVFSLLLAISAYDMRHKIIPDGFVYLFSGIALAWLFFKFGLSLFVYPAVWELASGFILAVPLFVLWLVSKGRWMGLGDAKLALGIGWLLGISQGLTAFFLAFWTGAAVSIALVIAERVKSRLSAGGARFTMRSEVPFGPFLAFAAFITFLFNLNVLGLPF